jgi:hypothetical protein
MNAFESALKKQKDCVLYFNKKAKSSLSTLATLLALRNIVKKSGASFKFHLTDSREEFDTMAETDWSKIYCYLEVAEKGLNLLFSHYEGEHIYTASKISYKSAFSSPEVQAIEQAENYKHIKQVTLENLWLMVSVNPDSKQIKAMIADRLIYNYSSNTTIIDSLMRSSKDSVYSIYLHVLDYCKRHKLRIFSPKNTAKKNARLRVEGTVVSINQADNNDLTYLNFGFEKHPEAEFIINFWNNGIFQVMSKGSNETNHVELPRIYDLVIEEMLRTLETKIIPLSTIKWVLEQNTNELVNYTFEQFLELKPHLYYGTRSNTQVVINDKEKYIIGIDELTPEMWEKLDSIGISLLDLLQLTTKTDDNSLTIIGFLFYGKAHRPNKAHKLFSIEKGVKLASQMRHRIVKLLNKEMPELKPINEGTRGENQEKIKAFIERRYVGKTIEGDYCKIRIVGVNNGVTHGSLHDSEGFTLLYEVFYRNENYYGESLSLINAQCDEIAKVFGLYQGQVHWDCVNQEYW